jgi:hypothetical protein
MLQNHRTVYFPAGGETVLTALATTGQYVAWFLEPEDFGRARGHGHSRLAAIADLQAKRQAEED